MRTPFMRRGETENDAAALTRCLSGCDILYLFQVKVNMLASVIYSPHKSQSIHITPFMTKQCLRPRAGNTFAFMINVPTDTSLVLITVLQNLIYILHLCFLDISGGKPGAFLALLCRLWHLASLNVTLCIYSAVCSHWA